MLPKTLLADRRVPGESIETRITRYGHVAVISALDDMVERARSVSMGESEYVGAYPGTVSKEDLGGILTEIKFPARSREEPAVALTPLFFEAMFPGVSPLALQ